MLSNKAAIGGESESAAFCTGAHGEILERLILVRFIQQQLCPTVGAMVAVQLCAAAVGTRHTNRPRGRLGSFRFGLLKCCATETAETVSSAIITAIGTKHSDQLLCFHYTETRAGLQVPHRKLGGGKKRTKSLVVHFCLLDEPQALFDFLLFLNFSKFRLQSTFVFRLIDNQV